MPARDLQHAQRLSTHFGTDAISGQGDDVNGFGTHDSLTLLGLMRFQPCRGRSPRDPGTPGPTTATGSFAVRLGGTPASLCPNRRVSGPTPSESLAAVSRLPLARSRML